MGLLKEFLDEEALVKAIAKHLLPPFHEAVGGIVDKAVSKILAEMSPAGLVLTVERKKPEV